MTDGDDKLSRRYRELAREEPPSSLDAAILAASRREVAGPSFSRRWGVPVSIAAVLVLAFGVTLEMQHDKPDISTSPPTMSSPAMPSALPPGSAPMQAPEQEPPPEDKPAKHEAARTVAPPPPRAQPLPQLRKSVPAQERSARDEMQAAPARATTNTTPVTASTPPAPPPMTPNAPAPDPARAAGAVSAPAAADYNVAPAAAAPTQRAKSVVSPAQLRAAPNPQQELEHIAKLRADGNDAEADRLLEEFLRSHPDYQIPDATWERVKPR